MYDLVISSIEPGASVPVMLTITTSGDTDKGTYFVRHHIVFTYNDTEFEMSSRGYFTWDQWEGFDYSNLYYQLDGSAGIVPDSSFSVKDPVPLWPLATLITLCVLFGALAVVFYLAEEHGDQYPRLKKGLQYWTGRWEQTGRPGTTSRTRMSRGHRHPFIQSRDAVSGYRIDPGWLLWWRLSPRTKGHSQHFARCGATRSSGPDKWYPSSAQA